MAANDVTILIIVLNGRTEVARYSYTFDRSEREARVAAVKAQHPGCTVNVTVINEG